MYKSLIKHKYMIFCTHVYNIVLEVNGVEKECKKESWEDSIIEAREPWSPDMATWTHVTPISLSETTRKD